MIIKSSIRGYSGELARHLGNGHDNEQVRIIGASNNFMRFDRLGLSNSEELHLLLKQMDLEATGHKKDSNHLCHVSISPEVEMDEIQYARSWELYEREFKLEGRMYIEVEHEKEGRTHRHRVYYALDEKGRYMNNSSSYPRNEKVARLLEFEFGHDPTAGRFNQAVHNWLLSRDKEIEVAEWMEDCGLLYCERPVAQQTFREKQISERTGLDQAAIKEFVALSYENSDTGKAFEASLAEHNLYLTRGDRDSRRGRAGRFVIVDGGGTATSLNRCGVKIKEFSEKFSDIRYEHLPTASSVQDHVREQNKDQDKEREGKDGGGENWRELKAQNKLLKSESENLKNLDEKFARHIQGLWDQYHKAKEPYQDKIDKVYYYKKEKLKKSYKPQWRKLFRKHENDIRRAKADYINIPNKLVLLYKYRKEIRQHYGQKEFWKYARFWFSKKKQLDFIEKGHLADKKNLMERYSRDCLELYQREIPKTKHYMKIQTLRFETKAAVSQLKKKQDVVRETRKQGYIEQKRQFLERQKEHGASLRDDIAKMKGRGMGFRPKLRRIDFEKMREQDIERKR